MRPLQPESPRRIDQGWGDLACGTAAAAGESNAYLKWRSEQEEYYRGQGRWDKGDWYLPALSEKEAIDHAAEMADRFHKMYMRTLRQMREHRRYSPVLINNANQVNIAADGCQQINVTSTE